MFGGREHRSRHREGRRFEAGDHSHFGGKKELFSALVAEASSSVIGETSPKNIEGKNINDTLRMFGLQVTRVLMTPTTLGLYRAVIAEGLRQPDVAQAFLRMVPAGSAAAWRRYWTSLPPVA